MYLGKVKKLRGHSKCFKGVTRKNMVGGAESAPPGSDRVKSKSNMIVREPRPQLVRKDV